MNNFWLDEREALWDENSLQQKLIEVEDDSAIFKVKRSLLSDLMQELESLRKEESRRDPYGL